MDMERVEEVLMLLSKMPFPERQEVMKQVCRECLGALPCKDCSDK